MNPLDPQYILLLISVMKMLNGFGVIEKMMSQVAEILIAHLKLLLKLFFHLMRAHFSNIIRHQVQQLQERVMLLAEVIGLLTVLFLIVSVPQRRVSPSVYATLVQLALGSMSQNQLLAICYWRPDCMKSRITGVDHGTLAHLPMKYALCRMLLK